MRYWDSSALVPLLVAEPTSNPVRTLLGTDADVLTWWATTVECASAIGRRERENGLDADAASTAMRRLDAIASAWHEILPTERVRTTAVRLVRTHPLRMTEALQLAAAIVAAEGQPRSLPFVTLDERLAGAADREGFPVIRPA